MQLCPQVIQGLVELTLDCSGSGLASSVLMHLLGCLLVLSQWNYEKPLLMDRDSWGTAILTLMVAACLARQHFEVHWQFSQVFKNIVWSLEYTTMMSQLAVVLHCFCGDGVPHAALASTLFLYHLRQLVKMSKASDKLAIICIIVFFMIDSQVIRVT